MRFGAPSRLATALLVALVAPDALPAQDRATGVLSGMVRAEGSAPVDGAAILLTSRTGAVSREATTDADGRFRIAALAPGLYDISVRRVGFRAAAMADLRVIGGRTTDVDVVLVQSRTRLSQVLVLSTPTAVDATTPEVATRLERTVTTLLPTARDASSLVALVPGARKELVWGGAGELANNVQLDGMAVNHPGIGGDFLQPSVDWIEALEVRGLGAGAADGNFQGGIIDAITRSGSNRRTLALRTWYDSPSLTSSNFNLQEDGAEQKGRLELSGEAGGPIRRDRLFYFIGAQYVGRDVRVPDLATDAPRDFRDVYTEQRTVRGIGKLTWLPSLGARVDALLGHADLRTDNFGLTGFDDARATQQVEAPTTFWSSTWLQPLGGARQLDVRLTGYRGRETREGMEGTTVPGLQMLRSGREPAYQNAAFTDRLDPASVAFKGTFSDELRWSWLGQRLLLGGEFVRGTWERERVRNGGVTWRPYPLTGSTTIDPANTATWADVASEWGGAIDLDGTVRNGALFVEDALRFGSRVTLTAGLRYGRWRGAFDVDGGSRVTLDADGWDPRVGLSADITGDNTLAFKAHWGRYHQGMAASLVDRLAGVNAYENTRFYVQGPRFTDPRQVYTPAQRDALFRNPDTGTPYTYFETVVNESGPADGYRQPYVDQWTVGLEKSFGSRWKAEVFWVNRVNHDFVGLRDRNMAQNYTRIEDIEVHHRLGLFQLEDPSRRPLVLPAVYVSNLDLRRALLRLQSELRPPPPGLPFSLIPNLTWDPDYVLTVIPEARRRYDQASLVLRTAQARWNALGSVTWSRLEGNVAGVSGTGGTGASYTAGPWVRPNEAINFDGPLEGISELELKLWASARLGWGFEGGINVLHVTGERISPAFVMEAQRYRFTPVGDSRAYITDMFASLQGQPILLEPRGNRHYADRTIVDLRAERRFRTRDAHYVLTADVFNVLGNDEATLVKSTVDDRFISSANERYGAVRLRVAPRTVRLGVRAELPGIGGR